MSHLGQFIAFEGVEGAGKSTVIKETEAYLKEHRIKCHIFREPGGTDIGESLRHILKNNDYKGIMAAKTELLLMYASRVQLVEEKIKPALALGEWVLVDRFEWSTFAYQGAGRGIDYSLIQGISSVALDGFKPDHIFFLDIEPSKTMARMSQRGEATDRIESEPADFFNRIYQEYLKLAHASPNAFIIDARQSYLHVWQDVKQILDTVLGTYHAGR